MGVLSRKLYVRRNKHQYVVCEELEAQKRGFVRMFGKTIFVEKIGDEHYEI